MAKIKKCPSCGVDLDEDTIMFYENGDMIHSVRLDGKKTIQYDEEEFAGDGDSGFYCRECNKDLDLTEDDIVEILKQA